MRSEQPDLAKLAAKADGPLARYRRAQGRPLTETDVLASLSRADLASVASASPDPEKGFSLPLLARELLGDPSLTLDEHGAVLHQRDHGHHRREQIDNGLALAACYLDRPGLARAVHALTDEAEERSAGHSDVARFVTSEHLKALQLFTFAARVPAGEVRTAEEFGYAMGYFLARGDRGAASLMRFFAYYTGGFSNRDKYVNGGDVRPDHERWAGRHRYWEQLARASRAPRLGEGRAVRGADGSGYRIRGHEVIVRTAGGGAEPVVFATEEAASEWVRDRGLAGAGPLATNAACRTVREDEILARLLRDPDDGALRAATDDGMFTSHLRAEAYRAASVGGDPGQVRARFADAMLRAPGWALRDTGWPAAHRALGYLDRLAATPVSAAQARDAALTVRAARDHADQRLFERPAPRRRSVPAPRPALSPGPARQRPLSPPPPLPAPAGVTPHLLPNGSPFQSLIQGAP